MLRFSGVLGPAAFFAAAAMVAALLPDYSAQSQMISELGATGASHAALFNYLGFLPNGLLLMVFGGYFYSQLKRHGFHPLPALLVVVHGLGMLLATWFSCDLSCTPQEPTFRQMAHDMIGAIKFPVLHAAMLVFAVQLLRTGRGRGFAYGSVLLFAMAGVLLVLFVMSLPERALTGVFQRLFIAVMYLWLAALALKLEPMLQAQLPVRG